MPREEVKEFASLFLRKAKIDLGAIRKMYDSGEDYDPVLGFHAQQAIEKAIKAVVALTGHGYPFSHNIAMLIDVLREAGVKDIPAIDKPGTITVYAVEYRYDSYDEESPEINRGELQIQVKKVLDWAERIVNE